MFTINWNGKKLGYIIYQLNHLYTIRAKYFTNVCIPAIDDAVAIDVAGVIDVGIAVVDLVVIMDVPAAVVMTVAVGIVVVMTAVVDVKVINVVVEVDEDGIKNV